MKILYFCQFYPPEYTAAAFRVGDNSRIWTQAGHKVTVFTGIPNYPTGKIFDGFESKLLTENHDNGIRILRSKLVVRPSNNYINRFINYFSFLLFSIINVLFQSKKIQKDFDIVIATSGPIFVGLVGWIYAKLYRKVFIFELRDIAFKQLLSTGTNEKSFLYRIVRFIELFLCKKAKRVVVVTNGFKMVLKENGIPENKIDVITNGIVINDMKTKPVDSSDEFLISYFGTIGISQDIKGLLGYMQYMKVPDKSTRLLIIGEGAQKEEIIKYIEDNNIDGVTIKSGMSSKELEPYYTSSDLCLVSVIDSDDLKYMIPSKVFQIMGRGKPILFIGPNGEAADVIRLSKSGIALVEDFENNIQTLKGYFSQSNILDKINHMGINGYEYAKLNYNRQKLAERYLQILADSMRMGEEV